MGATKKINVLYIAKNIPVPDKKSNRVIFDIANNISKFATVSFLFPKEIIPFWLKNRKKFAHLYNLRNWVFEGFNITPIPYVKLPFRKMQFWTLFSLPISAKKYLQNNKKFDIVHAHYLLPDGYIAYKIFKKFGIPYVLTFRSQDRQYLELISPKNIDYKKTEVILNNAQKILVTNKSFKEYIDRKFNISCKIVPHGIEAQFFSKKMIQLHTSLINIITVAEAIPRKNIDWVIKAVKAYTGNKEIKLNIVGEGPLLGKFKKLVDDDKRITFHGLIKRKLVLELLSNNNIFALPSINETFGMVYLEAAATQNAIIGFKGEGVWGVFEDSKEMLFCENFDEFKFQLHTLIDDNTIRLRLEKNAFAKAQEMQWSNVTKMYENIYANALTEKK